MRKFMHIFMQVTTWLWPDQMAAVYKFEFGESFGVSLEEDCHEVEVIPNLELFSLLVLV
jgi:hypothetical protein